MVATRYITQRSGRVHVVLLDDEDAPFYDRFNWSVAVGDNGAVQGIGRTYGPVGAQRHATLSRELLGLQCGDPRQGDHVDRNPLNNQRSNLRITTAQQNTWNRNMRMPAGGLPRGVRLSKNGQRYRANIRVLVDGRAYRRNLGTFDTAEEAGAAWRAEALRIRGAEFVYD